MPSLGADMEAGTLTDWLVKPGDTVSKGDIVAVVETQKGAIEIEIFEAGEIAELLADPGQTLPVGAPLARIRNPGAAEEGTLEPAPEAEVSKIATPAAPPSAPSAPHPPTHGASGALPGATAPGGLDKEVGSSPAARALAAEAGLDMAAVAGSGPGGAVLLADVEAHLKTIPAPAKTSETSADRSVVKGKSGLDMTEMRRAIAAAMSRAKREIPHYYLTHEIDLQAAQDWLSAHNAELPPDQRVLMGALLIRATVRALAKVPELNGRFEQEPFAPASVVHCGMAIAMRGGGLIAPAILDAQDKDLAAVMAAMRDLVARTRTGRLRNSELTQGTITISSLGESGVDALIGVIYPPQVALVGFGAPRQLARVHKGGIAPRLAVTASLAADHRVRDGRRGAVFLGAIDQLLQEPDNL